MEIYKKIIFGLFIFIYNCSSIDYKYISKHIIIPKEQENIAWTRAQAYIIKNNQYINIFGTTFDKEYITIIPKNINIQENFIQIQYSDIYNFYITKELSKNKDIILRIHNPIAIYKSYVQKTFFKEDVFIYNYTAINKIIEYVITGESKDMIDFNDLSVNPESTSFRGFRELK